MTLPSGDSTPPGLSEAWAAVEAALPEYWRIRSLIEAEAFGSWEVVATDSRSIIRASGPDALTALLALAARLTGEAS